MDVESLEHIDVKHFYEKFRDKFLLTKVGIEKDVESFLAGDFPDFS